MNHLVVRRCGALAAGAAALLLAFGPALPSGSAGATTGLATGFTAGSVKTIPGHGEPSSVACPKGKAVGSSTCYVLGSPNGSGGVVSQVVKGAPHTFMPVTDYGLNLACPTTTTCLVAATGSSGGVLEWLTNGVVTKTVTLGNSSYLYDVACESSTKCIVVGQGGTSTTYGVIATVTESESSASAVKVSGTTVVQGVSCPTSTACYAVGTTSYTNGKGVVFKVSGGKAGALKDASGISALDNISCGTLTTCWATGYTSSTTKGVTSSLTKVTSGVPGSKMSAPEFGGAIACVSATTCMVDTATAQYGHGKVDELVSGKVSSSKTFSGFAYGTLTGVSCPTATSCIVTGPMSFHNPGPGYYYIGGVAKLTL